MRQGKEESMKQAKEEVKKEGPPEDAGPAEKAKAKVEEV